MKVLAKKLATLLLITLFASQINSQLSSMSSKSSSSSSKAPAKLVEVKTPVNIIKEEHQDTGGEMQSFLDQMDKKEAISKVNETINALDDRLDDIEGQIKMRLNQISSQGNCSITEI